MDDAVSYQVKEWGAISPAKVFVSACFKVMQMEKLIFNCD